MSGQPHAQDALHLGKQPPAPTKEEAGWVPHYVKVLWRTDTSPAPTRNQTPNCQVCSAVTLLATLPWLPVTLLRWKQAFISWDVMAVWCMVTAFNSPQMVAPCFSDVTVTTYQYHNPQGYSLKHSLLCKLQISNCYLGSLL